MCVWVRASVWVGACMVLVCMCACVGACVSPCVAACVGAFIYKNILYSALSNEFWNSAIEMRQL